MKKFIHDFKVIKKWLPGSNHVILHLLCPEPLPPIKAGQFAEVLIPDEPEVFLRRPISIHDVDAKNNTISLFVKIVGKGTQKLSELRVDDTLNLLYPLGQGFEFPEHDKILLVGGGCGVAPLLFLAHSLSQHNYHPDILMALLYDSRRMFYDMGLDVKYKMQEGEEKVTVESTHEEEVRSALVNTPRPVPSNIVQTNLGVVG